MWKFIKKALCKTCEFVVNFIVLYLMAAVFVALVHISWYLLVTLFA